MVWWSKLYNLLPEETLRDYWNSQWPRTIVFWDLGKNGRQPVQECLVFSDNDWNAVDDLLRRIGHWPADLDGKVKFIMSRLLRLYPQPSSYRTDSQKHRVPDYWQSPSETISSGTGDCDDWGILLYALLRRAGVPSYRLKCSVTGIVVDGAPAGFHFHVLYLAKRDYEWYTLEGTWYPERALTRFLSVPRAQSTDLYSTILFTFNEEYVWAQHSFSLSPSFRSQQKR